jgi:hypothetical protein
MMLLIKEEICESFLIILPGAMQKYALANQLQMYQEISFTASSNIF